MSCSASAALAVRLGVLAAFEAWVNSADSAVRSVEVEVQTLCATTIAVYAFWLPHGDRLVNAWTNDFRALPVCCNILHPWEEIIKHDRLLSRPVADAIESVPGQVVQRSRRSTCCFCLLNCNNILRP